MMGDEGNVIDREPVVGRIVSQCPCRKAAGSGGLEPHVASPPRSLTQAKLRPSGAATISDANGAERTCAMLKSVARASGDSSTAIVVAGTKSRMASM
jgi:hypothetical protein